MDVGWWVWWWHRLPRSRTVVAQPDRLVLDMLDRNSAGTGSTEKARDSQRRLSNVRCVTVLRPAILLCLCAIGCGSPDARPTVPEIVVSQVTRIGSPDGPDWIGGLVSLGRLWDGRYVLYDMLMPGKLRIFNPRGQYISEFGRPGQGPGEFRVPTHHSLDSSGDTLRVVDAATGRLSLWSADGTVLLDARSTGFGQFLSVLFNEDGSMIFNALRPSRSSIGLPLHLVDAGGNFIVSFGTDSPVHIRGDNLTAHARVLAAGEAGEIWVAPAYQYRVERWSPAPGGRSDGFSLDTVFSPGTVTFPPPGQHQFYPRSRDSPEDPSPFLVGLWYDQDRRIVWVMIHVAHEDWRERYDGEGVGDPTFFSPGHSFWRTRVDALDASSGALIASTLVEESLMGFIGAGQTFSYGLDAAGNPHLVLWELGLAEKNQ